MKQKLLYIAPESDSLEVLLNGVIATSDPLLIAPSLDKPFGDEDTWSL